ncbi:MAG: cell division ATPase MinD [Candidatus Heimdallarchaeaceae archaeon]
MKGKILGIVSGKGGVGKTTTTANLGVALANEFGKNVLALDGNITTANLGLHLGLVYPPITLQDVLKNKLSLIQATYIHNSGLRVIPSSLTFEEGISTKHLWRKVKRLANQYELILIDSSPGLGKEVLNVMKVVDELLIITTPNLPSIITSMKSIDLAKKMKIPILGLVLNRVHDKSYELGENEIINTLEVPVIAKISEDEKIPESIAAKIPLVFYRPYSHTSVVFKRLAAYLVGEEYRPPSIWDKIKSLFSRKKEERFLKNKDLKSV